MTPREFLILFGVCSIWAFHFLVAKSAVAEMPPIAYAALRMGFLAVVLSPFLKIYPGRMGRIVAAGLLLGSCNFALFFSGIALTTPATAAIVIELSIPFATLLSVAFLGEQVGWRRTVGIAVAFAGVAVIAFEPDQVRLDVGALLVAGAALVEAGGAIVIKSLAGVPPLRLQAWVAAVGALAATALTLTLETGQAEALAHADLSLIGAVLYSAIGASLIAHTSYYWLLHRRPVSEVAPFTLMCPVMALALGVTIAGEPLTARMLAGGAMTLAGVGFILRRTAKRDTDSPVFVASEQP